MLDERDPPLAQQCLDQIENLIAAVKDEAEVLRAIHRFAFVEIPKDPARLGGPIGPRLQNPTLGYGKGVATFMSVHPSGEGNEDLEGR